MECIRSGGLHSKGYMPCARFDDGAARTGSPARRRAQVCRVAGVASARTIVRLCDQMEIGQKVGDNITAQPEVALAAVAADSGHLGRALVDMHVVDLIRFGR